MAQIANGCRLQYVIASAAGAGLESETTLTWLDIEDATNIPELMGSTSAVEVTRIIDMAKIYIPGISDNGGNLDFTCQFTPELLELVDAIRTAQETKEIGFRVLFPKPLDAMAYFKGKVAKLTNEAVESEGVLSAKLSVFPMTAVDTKKSADVTSGNPFKEV